ncbi:MAG: PAC2 family protein, partial [Candidatus Bathyarchaeota archaeon]
DAKAAKVLLEVLAKMLDIKIDMKPLEKEAKLSEEFVQKFKEMERQAVEEMHRASAPDDRKYYV